MTLDEEEYAFFHEIGLALMAWSQVENSMRDLLMSCAGSSWSLSVSYLTIENFRSRHAFLDKFLTDSQRANAQAISRWSGLSKRILSAAQQRNELAHWQALKFPDEESGRRMGLIPFRLPPSQKLFRDAITIRFVVQRRMTFHALLSSLLNFQFSLRGLPETFPESPELPPRPPTVRQIEARMREALGRHPRPSGSLRRQGNEGP